MKKQKEDYWEKRKKLTKVLEGAEIKSAHVPFRNLEKFAECWKTDKLDIIEMEIAGMYTRTKRYDSIQLNYLDDLCNGGFSIAHSSAEIFRWDRLVKAYSNQSLNVLEILRKLQLPVITEIESGKTMRITPSTLYLKRLKFRFRNDGQIFQLKGKVPKGLLKEQARHERVKGDKDKRLVVLDIYNGDGERIDNPTILKRIGDVFPRNILYYRVCKYEKKDDIKIELECKEIWNTGDEKNVA